MGIIKDFSAFRKSRRENMAFAKELRSKIGNRWSDPPIRNTEEWLEQFEENPRMNPVAKIATTVSMLEFQYRNEKDQISEGRVTDFLETTNTMFTFSQLLFLTSGWLRIIGECGWLVERGISGLPVEAFPIPPHWINETPTFDKPYYTITLSADDSSTYLVPKENFLYFRNPRLAQPYSRAYGQTKAIGDEIETDEYMAKYTKRFFYNDATPPLLIIAEGADKAAKERLREEWRAKHQGGINAYEPAFFSSDLKIEVLKQSQREMDFVSSRKFLRNLTIEHYGIPKEIFGITEDSNRSTIDVAEYIYMKYVIRPEALYIQNLINSQLLPLLKEKGKFEFMNIVPDDQERKLKRANDGLNNGALLLDEWREQNGFEPLPNNTGQVRFIKSTISEIRAGENQADIEDEEFDLEPEEDEEMVFDEEEESKSLKKSGEPTPFQITLWNRMDSGLTTISNSMATKIAKYFDTQSRVVIEGFIRWSTKAIKLELEEDFNSSTIIDWDIQEQTLMTAMFPFWMEASQHGFTVVEESYAFGINWDVDVRPEALDSVRLWGSSKVTGITATSQDELNSVIIEGLQNGDSVDVLSAKIAALYEGYKGARARMIAITEVHNAMNDGAFVTYIEAGVQEIEWLTTLDGKERASHREVNGERTKIGIPFSNGLLHPGDPSSDAAGEIINCRCTFTAVIDVDNN